MSSFHKQHALATPEVAVAGEIDLGHVGVFFDEAEGAFHEVEIDVGNVLRVQPAMDEASLQREGELPEMGD
jgi:hypothetical protein